MATQMRQITIVDDNPEDRAAVRRYLAPELTGYRLREFDTAEEAIVACQASAPDCLLLDYELQGSDGLEVLERLTGGTGVATFAIVFLTGRGSESVAVQALKRGAVDYIVKGADTPEMLRQTVADAIDKFANRPLVERQRAERERAHRASGDVAPGRERLVLIVDDSPEDRMSARRALARASAPAYRFLEEGNAAEGLALCRSAGLDCLLLDYSLPDADGIEFLDELTGGTGITPFPVIMLTGRGDEAIAVQALKHGAVDYLIKGRFTPETLQSTIDQAIIRLADRRIQEEQRVRVLERLEAEARQKAEQLTEADRRKDEFLAMLAHELRNPLAPITNAMHIMRRIEGIPLQADRLLDIADRQLKHLARLVDDLMEVSRITRGKITFKREPMELGPVLRRAVDAARPFIEARRHDLILDIPSQPIFLNADPTRMEQIFSNLLNNAAKYTDPEGLIRVSVLSQSGKATVSVKDSGIGIDRETLPHVFDLFTQADRSLDRSQGGLGIGLTLVRSLTEQLGGSVQARSGGTGQGSEFVVSFSTIPRPENLGPQEIVPTPEPGPLKVLVVDDNVDGTDLLALLFRSSGYEVRTAYDGPTGLDAVRAMKPDVVFLDIGLPHMSGYEVAEAIRDEMGNDGPVLIALTGYGQADDRKRTEKVGFQHHLIKPVDPDELLRLASTVAPRHRRPEAKSQAAGGGNASAHRDSGSHRQTS